LKKPEEENTLIDGIKPGKNLDESSDSEETEDRQNGLLEIPDVSLLTTANKLTKYVLE
jgi:hypothetical protein